ncbi:MAG: type IV pilus modification protein PilV [Trichloromonas sp.]|jgi:type IV pilus assembly protein PilV|nr:type IV pilus modification protein PilV [Trichloromonas sp.]
MKRENSGQAGFSLIELLVAIVILAIGLLGLAELQVTAIRANSQSETMLAAATIAQGVIEEIAAMSRNDPMFSDNTAGEKWERSDSPYFTPVTVEGGGSYDITYDVETNYEGVENLSFITVRVVSTGNLMQVGGNRARRAVVTTIKIVD